MSPESRLSPTILRRKEVEIRTGLSRSTIYAYIQASIQGSEKSVGFPIPVRLGIRSIGFLENEINQWIETRGRTRQLIHSGTSTSEAI